MRWVVVLTSGFRELPVVAQDLGPLVEISRPKSWGPATPASTRLGIPIQPTTPQSPSLPLGRSIQEMKRRPGFKDSSRT